ncbi:cation:proton antiporter [Microbacterium sp. NPDC006705]|uniref:cation:proton antiporter n=1 Tax=unclassified Microbacterium TaxID=2609290 RepID=UPI00249ED8A5|nr:monovalent cation/H(+) antiporter subunit G [Microbacterium sp. BDGP8]WHE35965.1 monovalent cation/H(+) antiporter subunit G [Microbacterium sp. BDGP8]
MTILELIGQIIALLGALIFVVAAVGLRRFPDPYARISAVATAAGLGVAFITVGAVLQVPTVDNVVKVVLAVLLQLITSAVAAIVIARAAVSSGHRFTEGTDTAALDEDG